MKTQLKLNEKRLFLEKRLSYKTAYEYRVSGGGKGGGVPGGVLVIDSQGNFRPNAVWGQTYFVDYRNGSDENNGLNKSSALKTYSAALGKVTSNNNDLVVIDGDSTIVETAMVSNTKNRFTVMGVGGGVMYGQGVKISSAITSGATNIATYKNTGVRVTHANIKWVAENTVAEGIWGVAEGGEYAVHINSEFYKSTDLDVTTSAELLLNADSAQFYGCTFGSLADSRSGTVIRPAVWLGKGVVGSGLVCRDVLFDSCLFWIQASHTTSSMVHAPAATDVERQMLFKGCGFINNKTATATPAQAISCASSLTVGQIILDPNCFAANVTKVSTSTGVIVTGSAVNSGAGIGVNAA